MVFLVTSTSSICQLVDRGILATLRSLYLQPVMWYIVSESRSETQYKILNYVLRCPGTESKQYGWFTESLGCCSLYMTSLTVTWPCKVLNKKLWDWWMKLGLEKAMKKALRNFF